MKTTTQKVSWFSVLSAAFILFASASAHAQAPATPAFDDDYDSQISCEPFQVSNPDDPADSAMVQVSVFTNLDALQGTVKYMASLTFLQGNNSNTSLMSGQLTGNPNLSYFDSLSRSIRAHIQVSAGTSHVKVELLDSDTGVWMPYLDNDTTCHYYQNESIGAHNVN